MTAFSAGPATRQRDGKGVGITVDASMREIPKVTCIKPAGPSRGLNSTNGCSGMKVALNVWIASN